MAPIHRPLVRLAVALGIVALLPGCPVDPGADEDGGADAGTTDDAAPPGNDATPPGTDSGPAPPGCGRGTSPCPVGGPCEGAQDCQSGSCQGGVCAAVNPKDGVKNGDETDVDCGGLAAPACDDGKTCKIAGDCVSGVCTAGVCQAPSPTDGVKNGDETGKDCGGTKAPKCPTGEGCLADTDCASAKCDPATKKCSAPTYTDGIKNGDETGKDCGGPNAPNRCPTGEGCVDNTDCDNVLCDGATKKCNAPAPDDGLKNGTETDVDCGGVGNPKCAEGKTCALAADCASDGCAYDNKCAPAPSCAVHYGGDTCGKREIGQAGATHESCCASLPLADNSVRVDKYEITAGRMREFIRRTGGNVRAWVDANRAITQQIPDTMLPYLPQGNSAPTRNIIQCDEKGQNCGAANVNFGVYGHLGNMVFMPDRPCNNCGQGCFVNVNTDAFGHPTYWWPAATQQGQWGASARDFDQNTLDVKSLNCVTQVLLAAFCAWDGGRLPTQAELGGANNNPNSAWGAAKYPWGAAPEFNQAWDPADPAVATYSNAAGNTFVGMINTNNASVVVDAPDRNPTNWNPFGWSVPEVRYAFPQRPFNTWARADQAFAVAAPGRMTRDRNATGAGALDGWFDVAGNLMEVTGDYIAAVDDANHNSFPRVRWVGGSFEGHSVNNRGGYNLSVLTKYGKQGGRCARPMP